MKAVLASNNAHKLQEIRAILGDCFEHIYSLKEMGLDIEIEENGKTFVQNAIIKADTVCRMTGLVAIADDSGLEVEALGGQPGVYSARFAGEPCDDDANNALLLDKLHESEKTKPVNRKARFVSVVAICYPDGSGKYASGSVDGSILDEYRGDKGFGYDPLFYCDQLSKTFAQATMEEKNTVSHRARALQKLREML
ncbi:MAG: XTP/dITP diphosphatase [Christensenellales bacterium]